MILHALNQRFDRFATKVIVPDKALGRQRIGLVDEQHAVEGPLHGLVGLVCGMSHVLTHKPRTIDLDEMALLEQTKCAIHLAQETGDGGLSRPRIPEEHEVLTGGHFAQTVILAPCLDLEKRDLGTDLLFDRFEPHEGIEFSLNLFERARSSTQRSRWQTKVAETLIDTPIDSGLTRDFTGLFDAFTESLTSGHNRNAIGVCDQPRSFRGVRLRDTTSARPGPTLKVMTRRAVFAAIVLAIAIAACTQDPSTDNGTAPDPESAATTSSPTSSSSTASSTTTGSSESSSGSGTPVSPPAEGTPGVGEDGLEIVFTRPFASISDDLFDQFVEGQILFNAIWSAPGSGQTPNEGLGPFFNATSCAACHASSGRRGAPPVGPLAEPGVIIRVSRAETDSVTRGPVPEPSYGDQIQDGAIDGLDPEATITTDYFPQPGTFPDGQRFELQQPAVGVANATQGQFVGGVQVSARIGSQLIGTGLIEAITEETLLGLADPSDENSDGISGRVNSVWNPITEQAEFGRFGWKSNVATLEQQIAQAFNGDMGITSSLIPAHNCAPGQDTCTALAGDIEIEVTDEEIDLIATYLRLLAVPETRTAGNPVAERGQEHFREFGCASCHTESITTGPSDIPELSEVTIAPYSDFLLHDLGNGLTDMRPEFQANGLEWRTQPLWGLGLIPVEGDRGFLHDGRARTLEEAILWHGGEAQASRSNFVRADAQAREELLEFLRSL